MALLLGAMAKRLRSGWAEALTAPVPWRVGLGAYPRQRHVDVPAPRPSEQAVGSGVVSDAEAGFDIREGEFARFDQRNDAFCRSWWDSSYQETCGGQDRVMAFYEGYRRPLAGQWKRRGGGFTQHDFAFRNAAWHIADIFAEMREGEGRREGFLDPLSALRDGPEERCDVGSPEEASRHLKHAALALGADLVGVTHADERWQYTKRYAMATPEEGKPNEMPAGCDHVVVLGQVPAHPDLRSGQGS